MSDDSTIEAAILRAVADRGPEKSICPSEVARALAADWRPLLSATRRAAIRLAVAGRLDILRKGHVVDPAGVKGVIRLRAPRIADGTDPGEETGGESDGDSGGDAP